jgi:hypothetical protein
MNISSPKEYTPNNLIEHPLSTQFKLLKENGLTGRSRGRQQLSRRFGNSKRGAP